MMLVRGLHQLNLSASKQLFDPEFSFVEFSVYLDIIPKEIEPWVFPIITFIIIASVIHSLRHDETRRHRNDKKKKHTGRKEDHLQTHQGDYRIPLAAKQRNLKLLNENHPEKNNFSAAFISEDVLQERNRFESYSIENISDNIEMKSILGTIRQCVYCGNNLSGEDTKCPKCGMLNFA